MSDSNDRGKGLIIIAGLDDFKLAHVQSIQEYTMRSDYVFIVSQIARTRVDKYVKHFVDMRVSQDEGSEGESKKKKAQLVIVCTMTEVLSGILGKKGFLLLTIVGHR